MKQAFASCTLYAIFFNVLFLTTCTLTLSLPQGDKIEAKICENEACKIAAKRFKNSIDINVNPCDDFYLYACGNYPKTHNNKSGIADSIDTWSQRTKKNDVEIINFIKKNNTNDEPEIVHKVRELFSMCLNQSALHNAFLIEVIMQEVGLSLQMSLSNETLENYDYTTILAKLARKTGIAVFFDLKVLPDPFDRTVNVVQILQPSLETSTDVLSLQQENLKNQWKSNSNKKFGKPISKQCENNTSLYCKFSASTFTSETEFLLVEMAPLFLERIKVVTKLGSLFNSTLYTSTTLRELQDITDGIAKEVNSKIVKFNWTRYIEEMFTGVDNVTLDLKDPSKVKIVVKKFHTIRGILKFMFTKSAEEIKYSIWYSIMWASHNYWVHSTEDPVERETKCAKTLTTHFGMAISYLYAINENFIKAKTEVRKMFEYIRQIMKEVIEQSSWMDEKTREKALKKLASMKSYNVYPSSITSHSTLNDFYSHVKIKESFMGSIFSIIQIQIKHKLSKLNEKNDLNKDNWETTPNIVNAFNLLKENIIVIPAASVARPIYDVDSLAALNYGTIGMAVGHEITHAFDNQGRQYNDIGNLENWWQKETLEKYIEKAKCFVKVYDTYNVTINGVIQKTDSKVTIGEDISDNGGFKESLLAYRKYISENGKEPLLTQYENYTHEQLLTLSFANLWCQNPPESVALNNLFSELSEHSYGAVRVNGVLRNSNEFSEIWNCPEGTNMNPNVEKCSVW